MLKNADILFIQPSYEFESVSQVEFIIKCPSQNTFWCKQKTQNEILNLLISFSDCSQRDQLMNLFNDSENWRSYLNLLCEFINHLVQDSGYLPTQIRNDLQQFFQNEAITVDELQSNRYPSNANKKKTVQIKSQQGSQIQDIIETPFPQRSQTQANMNKGILKNDYSSNRNKNFSHFQRSVCDEHNFSQYIKIKLKQEDEITFCQLDSPQAFERFLGNLLYKEIRVIGRGATTITFKALNSQNQVIAVKVLKKSEEGLQAALLYKSINLDMANNLTGHFIHQHNIVEIADILIIEEDLANETLEDILAKKALKGETFQDEEIRTIIVEIAEQLYFLHVIKGCVHNDIKPENILVKAGHYVLSDLGVAELVDNFSSLLKANAVKEIKEIAGTVLYMSPAKLEHYHYCINNNLIEHNDVYETYVSSGKHLPSMTFNRQSLKAEGDQKFYHNPFKSDVYSFGLVIMRLLLHNQNVTLNVQIENIFYHNKNLLLEAVQRNPYYFHQERFILFQDQIKEIKTFLQILLEPDEEIRGNSLEIVLMLNSQQNILRSILTPLSKTFTPKIDILRDFTRVIYDVKKIIYEGQFDSDLLERTGVGIMFYTEDSFWTNNISYIHDQKKHQTIQDDEFYQNSSILELDQITSNNQSAEQPDRKTFISKLKDPISTITKEKVILYEGEWLKNYPHGIGQLNIYKNTQSSGYTSQKNQTFGGKTIKYKPSRENQQLGIQIQSQFYYGMLNGDTIIKIEEEQIEKQFVMNMSDSVLTQLKNLTYGVYTFVYDTVCLTVMGYFEDDVIMKEKRIYLFDLRDIQNHCIEKVLKSLFQSIQVKIETISYSSDKINGLGILDMHGIIQHQDVIITIIFAESLHAKRTFSRQIPRQRLNSTIQKRGCFDCFKQKKKIGSTDSVNKISREFEQNQLEANNNGKESILSLIMDSILSYISLQNLDKLDLSYGYLKHNTLQRLQNLSQFTKITQINFQGCQISDIRQVDNILLSQVSTYLKILNLSHLRITDTTLDSMISSDCLNQLKQISLQSCQLLTTIGLNRFLSHEKMKKIIHLDLSYLNAVDNKTILELKPDLFQSLRELIISGCINITADGFTNFIKTQLAKKLWTLKCDGMIQHIKEKQKVSLKIQEMSQLHNLRELSFHRLFLLDEQHLGLFNELTKTQRLKRLNLVYAFKSEYVIRLDTLLKLYTNRVIFIPADFVDRDQLNLSYKVKQLGQSTGQMGNSSIELSQVSSQQDSIQLVMGMDSYLIDVFIQELELAVTIDLTSIQTIQGKKSQNETDDSSDLVISELAQVDCSFNWDQNRNLLSHLILVQKTSKIQDLYFSVTKQNNLKVLQFLKDLGANCGSKIKVFGLILAFKKFGSDSVKIENFLQNLSELSLSNHLKNLEIITTAQLPEQVLSCLKKLRCIKRFTLNNYVLQMENQHIWDGLSIKINYNKFLSNKLFDQGQQLHQNQGEKSQNNDLLGSINLLIPNNDSFTQQTQIDDEVLQQLAQADGLQQLEKLYLRDQQLITDKGIEYVLKSHKTQMVHTLDLSNTNITGYLFELINNSKYLKNLVNIILNDCNKIEFREFQSFIKTQPAQLLQTFELSSQNINTIDQFFLLKQLKSLEKIKMVFLDEQEDQLFFTDLLVSKNLNQSDLPDEEEVMNDLYCLHLDFSFVQCQRIPQIVRALKNPNLEMVLLDLSNNGNIDNIVQDIFHFFKCQLQSLKEFSINISQTCFTVVNYDESSFPNTLGSYLKEFFIMNSSLEYLQVQYNPSEDQDIKINQNDSVVNVNLFLQQMTLAIVQLKDQLMVLDISLEKLKFLFLFQDLRPFHVKRSLLCVRDQKALHSLRNSNLILNYAKIWIIKIFTPWCAYLSVGSQSSKFILTSPTPRYKMKMFKAYQNMFQNRRVVIQNSIRQHQIQSSIQNFYDSCQNIQNAFKQYIQSNHKNRRISHKTIAIHLYLKKTNSSEQDRQKLLLIRNIQLLDSSSVI